LQGELKNDYRVLDRKLQKLALGTAGRKYSKNKESV